MKSYKEKFNKEIREVFAAYPDQDKLLVTSNGQVFLPNALSVVKDYCIKNGLKYEEVTRSHAADTDSGDDPVIAGEKPEDPGPQPVPQEDPESGEDPVIAGEKPEDPGPQPVPNEDPEPGDNANKKKNVPAIKKPSQKKAAKTTRKTKKS